MNQDEFEELMTSMQVGEKSSKPADADASPQKNTKIRATNQKNTLMNYFAKPKT